MTSRLKTLIELLHASGEIALGVNSSTEPGYPFLSSVAFATDEHHRPVLLISHLAEHTKNLLADPRASMLLAQPLGEGEIARATLIGNVVEFEPSAALVARYLRFHPAAERFLQLGDFRFFRMDPLRIRVVGGFAQAGWIDGKQLLDTPQIPLDTENRLIGEASVNLPKELEVLGMDAYGVDFRTDGIRKRNVFKSGPVLADAAGAALVRTLGNL